MFGHDFLDELTVVIRTILLLGFVALLVCLNILIKYGGL